MLSHVNDTERLFVFRAFWFARGFETPLPSFDQDVAVAGSGADPRSWHSHLDEFRTLACRVAGLFQVSFLPTRRGRAKRRSPSGNPFTVRALAFITAGHVAHHAGIVRDRYL